MAGQKHPPTGRRAARARTRTLTPPRRTPQGASDSEHLYRELFENANDALAFLSLDGVIQLVNRGAERLLGWSRQALIGQHYRTVVTPASAALVEQRTRDYLAGKKPASSTFEAELIRKDGSIVPVEARTRVVRDSAGHITGFQGIYRDLTERTQREAYFRALLEHLSDMIVLLNADGTIRYSSPSAERILGYRLDESTGKSGFDFVHPEDLPRVADAFHTLLSMPGGSIPLELRVQHRDGSWHTLDVIGSNLLQTPFVAGIVITARDITARKAAEAALRESEERYRLVSQSISDYAFSFRIDAAGDLWIEWLTDSFTTITGYRPDELIEHPNPLYVYIHPEDLERIVHTVRTLEPGKLTTYEFRIVTKSGAVRWLQSRAQAVADAAGHVIRFYGAARDITDARTTEQALRESEARYRGLVENAPDVIYTLGLDATLTSLNPAFETHTDWTIDEWLYKPFVPLLHPDDVAKAVDLFQRVVGGTPLDTFTLRVRTKAGAYKVGEFRAVPQKRDTQVVSVLGISRDITERITVEARLEESRHLLMRIADTVPEVLYLYELASGRMVYVNSRVTGVLGYTPEQLHGKDTTALGELIHPDDVDAFLARGRRLMDVTDDDVIEAEYRVRHVNGAYRWLQVRETVCTRTADGTPERILGVATDVTAQKRLRELARERVMEPADLAKRLRRFRDDLGLTQAEFGQRFGGYNQRQIFSYESGATDLPIKLVLAIQAQGYPVEAILGASSDTLLDETLTYLTASHRDRLVAEHLADTLLRLLQHDRTTIERILHELGVPPKRLTAAQQQVLERVAQVDKDDT